VLCKNESWRAAVQRTPDLPKWPANLHIILRLFRLCHRSVGPRRATTHFCPALVRGASARRTAMVPVPAYHVGCMRIALGGSRDTSYFFFFCIFFCLHAVYWCFFFYTAHFGRRVHNKTHTYTPAHTHGRAPVLVGPNFLIFFFFFLFFFFFSVMVVYARTARPLPARRQFVHSTEET